LFCINITTHDGLVLYDKTIHFTQIAMGIGAHNNLCYCKLLPKKTLYSYCIEEHRLFHLSQKTMYIGITILGKESNPIF